MNENIIRKCKNIQSGGVILYSTDTIWGIGCDATNENRIKNVMLVLKKRSIRVNL